MSVQGLVAHSSQPHLGDNAVYRAMDASERIRKMPRRKDPFFGTDVIELVEIKSKPSPGNGCVPDTCWVLWECRLFPGGPADFLNRFHTALKDFDGVEKVTLIGRTQDCYTGERLDTRISSPPGLRRLRNPSGSWSSRHCSRQGSRSTRSYFEAAPTSTSAQAPWASHHSSMGRATSTLHISPTSISISRSCCSAPGLMGR